MEGPLRSQILSKLRSVFLSLIVIQLVLAAPLAAHAATLTELENKLKQAQADLDRYKNLQIQENANAAQYADQIASTQADINQTQSTIASLNNQISGKAKDIDATTKDIINKSEELNGYNDQLNESLALLYELTNFSSVEMLADQKDISQYADRTEYMQSLQEHIMSNIDQAEKVKADLETKNAQLNKQKDELARLKGDQEDKSADLAVEKNQQTSLFNRSKANETAAAQQVKKIQENKNQISAQIYTLRQQLAKSGKETVIPGGSSYPWPVGPNTWQTDPWDFYKGECVSYAACKWYTFYGSPFRVGYDGPGDAYLWPQLAARYGYSTSKTPRVNSVVSWPRSGSSMPYGHVAWVEGVNADGTINVSEYNWVSAHAFSRRNNVAYWNYGSATFIFK
jgi:surface antigen